jgi:probable rRNA maturation factor
MKAGEKRSAHCSIDVEISDTQAHLAIDRDSLFSLVASVLRNEGRDRASISIAIVNDEAIKRLNHTHLGHDWPTDVITFPLSEPHEAVLAGELVVSAETACAAAIAHNGDPASELALYIVHGLLHLCGYDDRSDADAALLRRRQSEALAAAGIAVAGDP